MMKRLIPSLFATILFLAPLPTLAQESDEGIPPEETPQSNASAPPPSAPVFIPVRTGWVHEGAVGVYGMFEGDSGGFGAHYTGLYRPQPGYAFGLHAGASSIDYKDQDVRRDSTVLHVQLAAEGRAYLHHADWDLWAAVVIGGAWYTETDSTSDAIEMAVGPMLGFGVGLSFFLSPELSVGGYFRMYRLFPLEDSEGTFALWATFGAVASLHF